MKLLLHLVRTDVRRLAAWLLLWAAVLVAMDVLGFAVLASQPRLAIAGAAGSEDWRHYQFTRDALTVAEALLAFVLVVLLVQGDRVVGTRAFWMSRPIRGSTLLLAKCISAAVVLIGLPALISLPWWLWCGFGAHEIGGGVTTFCVEAVSLGVPAAFVATVMDSLSRALLWGLMVVSVALVLFTMALLSARPVTGVLPTALVPLRTVAVFATFMAVTIAQYVWRRGRVTGVVFGCGVVLCVVGWRPNVGYVAPFASRDAAIGAPVNVGLIHADALQAPGAPMVQVATQFEVTGVPSGMLIAGAGISQTWRASDRGRRVGAFTGLNSNFFAAVPAAAGFSGFMSHGARVPLFDAARRIQNELPQLEWSDPDLFVARVYLRPVDASVVTGQPVRYAAELGLSLLQPRIVAEQPLADSGWHAEAGRGLRLIGARRFRGSVGCAVITTALAPSFRLYPTGQDPEHRLVCAIIDRTTNALLPAAGMHEFAALTINSVMISCRSFGGGPFGDADDVTVAPIAMVEQARIVRRVQADDFHADMNEAP